MVKHSPVFVHMNDTICLHHSELIKMQSINACTYHTAQRQRHGSSQYRPQLHTSK